MNKATIFLAGVAVAAIAGYILSDNKKEEKKEKGYTEVQLDENGIPIPIKESEEIEEESKSKLEVIKENLSKEKLQENFAKASAWGINNKDKIELASIIFALLTSMVNFRNAIKDGKRWESGGKLNWFDYVKANAGEKSMLVSDVDNGVFVVEYKEAA